MNRPDSPTLELSTSELELLKKHASLISQDLETYLICSPDIFVTMDENGRFRAVSPAMTKILGYSLEEIRGITIMALVHPKDSLGVPEVSRQLKADDAKHIQIQRRMRHKKGHWVWLEWNLNQLQDGSIYAIGRDIHERKIQEQTLIKTKEELQRAYNLSQDMIITLDLQGRFLSSSPACTPILGYQPEEITGVRYPDLVHPDELTGASLGEVFDHQGGEIATLQRRMKHKTGRWVWMEWKLAISMDREVVYGTGRDITKSVRHQKALEFERDRAEEAVRAKSEFLANMSHEIRTPMNGVLGMLSLLQDSPLNDEQQSIVETAVSSGESLLTLINDILDLSKAEANKVTLESISFNLTSLLEDITALFSRKALEKGLEIASYIDEKVPGRVIGDPTRLRQVITNLLGNAIKFTEQGHVVTEVNVISENAKHIHLKFAVSDTGIGIRKNAQATIFECFSQADGSTTRKYGGTGLGLTICKQMVGLMGGEIGLTSAPGKGSTFWFTVPLGIADQLEESLELRNALRGRTALIVDDIEVNRRVLTGLLKKWGMEYVQTEDPLEAEKLLREENHFEILLLDEMMPGISGTELLRRTRPHKAIPCIIISSSGIPADKDDIPGQDTILEMYKPVRRNQLFSAICQLLGLESPAAAESRCLDLDVESPSPIRGTSVLVVEDNPINQKVAKKMLEKIGVVATCVANGEESLHAVASGKFDIVLMDCQMPVMDGFTATREIRKREAGSPFRQTIIAMTANAMEGDRERCLDAGMDDYLSKPIRPEKLRETLESWMQKNRS